MSRSRTLALAAAFIAISFACVSCTSGPTRPPSASPSHGATGDSATATPLAPGDGVLRIGTLLPTTGLSAFIAPAQAAGTELAVREINEAGGVLGVPVEVVHRDSGDSSGTVLETSFADLLAKKTDVVIGPSSSVLVARLLPKTIEAKIPVISPAAAGIALTSPANAGWFFRTIPSAALQSSALADAVAKAGAKKLAIIAFDDATGGAVTQGLASAMQTAGGTLVAQQSFGADTKDLAPVVAAIVKAAPEAVALVSPFSATAQNQALITALSAAGLGGAKLWLTSGNLADYSQALPAGLLKDVNGILEGAAADDAFNKRVLSAGPAVTDYRYAAEAYDAVMLAALAAIAAHNDSGAAVASQLRSVSSGGIKCMSFGECLDVLKTQKDIDYDGVSGPLTLDAAGDPSPAHYGVYRYSAENQYARVGAVLAG
jgi:ABC-type branched-subunit amino acid transport system substrate-binding protein